MEIAPSIYAADFSKLGEQLRVLLESGARLFHFDVGLSGQTFLAEACERIRRLRRLLPTAIIEVDGGIHDANIASVRQAGADLLVAGSAIFWGDDPGTRYRQLCARLDDLG